MKCYHYLIPFLLSIGFYCLIPKISFGSEKATVYFTKEISPEAIVIMYKKLNVQLQGNIALKVHSGEKDGIYFLTPNFLKKIYDYTKGTFVECNTAYPGKSRHSTELHMQLLKEHGWLDLERPLEIMDGDPTKDIALNIPNGIKIKKNYVGSGIEKYDSLLVLSHVKGHIMGGFGASLKQLSIGFASQQGKAYIHTAGNTTDWTKTFTLGTPQKDFTESMADAASSIVDYFNKKNKGGSLFINVIANVSINCDCQGGDAAPPEIKDIGILASTDPVAIDQASINLIKELAENNEGKKKWFKQLNDLLGMHTVNMAELNGIGSTLYNLVNIDSSSNSRYYSYGIVYILLLLSIIF